MEFLLQRQFSSQWFISLNNEYSIINLFCHIDEVLSYWWNFIVLMNFYHYDELFWNLHLVWWSFVQSLNVHAMYGFHLDDWFLWKWWALIRVIKFHQNTKFLFTKLFSLNYWTVIKIWNHIKLMKFYQIDELLVEAWKQSN